MVIDMLELIIITSGHEERFASEIFDEPCPPDFA